MNDLEQALRILRGSKQYNFNGTVLTVIGYYTGKRISLDLGKLDAVIERAFDAMTAALSTKKA